MVAHFGPEPVEAYMGHVDRVVRTASAHSQTDAALIQIELHARPQFDTATGTHIPTS